MSKTTLLLVRHCEAEGNIHRRTHGLFDSNITPKGKLQLEQLGLRFSEVEIGAVYSSSLRRARLTARAIADPKGFKIIEDYRLNERAMGIFEDRSWHEIKRKFPAEFAAWRADLWGYEIPFGESEAQSLARFKSALLDIARVNTGKIVVATTHSMLLRSLAESVGGAGAFGYCENTAVNEYAVDAEAGSFEIVSLNDHAHLPTELAPTARESWWRADADLDGYSLRFVHAKTARSIGDSALDAVFKGHFSHRIIWGYEKDECIGALAYSVKDYVVTLERIYIKEPYRCRGYATQLLGELIHSARNYQVGRLQCKRRDPTEDLLGLLEKNDFEYLPKPGLYIKPLT